MLEVASGAREVLEVAEEASEAVLEVEQAQEDKGKDEQVPRSVLARAKVMCA